MYWLIDGFVAAFTLRVFYKSWPWGGRLIAYFKRIENGWGTIGCSVSLRPPPSAIIRVEEGNCKEPRRCVDEMTACRNVENGGMKEEEKFCLQEWPMGPYFFLYNNAILIKLISNIVIKYPGAQINRVTYVCKSVLTEASWIVGWLTIQSMWSFKFNVVFRSHRNFIILWRVTLVTRQVISGF
jgi:hypothetical protein